MNPLKQDELEISKLWGSIINRHEQYALDHREPHSWTALFQMQKIYCQSDYNFIIIIKIKKTLGRTFVYSAPGPHHPVEFPCVPSPWMATGSTLRV